MAKEIQPITYKQVGLRLTKCIGLTMHEVRINWHTGDIVCFNDADDAMNFTPFIQTQWQATAAPRPCNEYVKEVFTFLQRGHSMLDPECQCPHGLSDERAKELGVPPHHSRSPCLVHRDRKRRSLREIALELNVQPDLDGLLVDSSNNMTLIQVLIQLAGLQLTHECLAEAECYYLHSSLCCVPPNIQSVDDVVDAARVLAPFPFTIAKEKLKMLMKFLVNEKQITMMTHGGNEECYHIFWNRTLLQVDNDVKELWWEHDKEMTGNDRNLMKRTDTLDRMLLSEGIRPTMQEAQIIQNKEPPDKIKKKKSSQKKKMCSSKRKILELF